MIRPTEISPRWDLASTRIYKLDDAGARFRHIETIVEAKDWLRIPKDLCPGTFEMLCGRAAARLSPAEPNL